MRHFGAITVIIVEWDNVEETIIRWTFPKKWAWTEFYKAINQNTTLVTSVTHKVDMIIDMRDTNTLPSNVLTQTGISMQTSPFNIGLIVVVGVHPLIRATFNNFRRINQALMNYRNSDVRIVALEHKAYELITTSQQHRKIAWND